MTAPDADTLAGLLARLRGQDPIPSRSEVADAIEALAAKDKARIERLEAALSRIIIESGGKTAFQLRAIEAVICAPAHGSKHDQNMQETPMTAPDTDTPKKKRCPACHGRGYRRCECWPGDCICGQDDQDCENCDGEGWIDDWEDDYDAC